jgi:hypothetical protein
VVRRPSSRSLDRRWRNGCGQRRFVVRPPPYDCASGPVGRNGSRPRCAVGPTTRLLPTTRPDTGSTSQPSRPATRPGPTLTAASVGTPRSRPTRKTRRCSPKELSAADESDPPDVSRFSPSHIIDTPGEPGALGASRSGRIAMGGGGLWVRGDCVVSTTFRPIGVHMPFSLPMGIGMCSGASTDRLSVIGRNLDQ